MSHHCTRTSANKLMFFENGRRVREGEYRQRYPNHKDEECMTKQQRRQRIQDAIRTLSGVRTEQNQLVTECQTRLGRCNKRVAELEAQLVQKNQEFIERERDVRAEMKSDIEDLQIQLRKGKDCSEEIAELTQKMTEHLNVARREKDEISDLLNATTSERDRLSGQLGDMTQREQNCNERMQKTQLENEKSLIDLREQAEANLRAEQQKCNAQLELVSRQLSDSEKYQTQLEELRKEHSECKERTRKLEQENSSLSSLPEQLTVLNRETQVIREQMANLVQQHDAELSGRTQQFSELQRKYDDLSVQFENLKQLETKCQKNLISDREAHDILRSANSALQGEYDEINEELQNMKRDLKRNVPVESAPALKASIQDLNDDRKELLGEIANLKSLADKNVLDKNELEGRFQALLSAKETIDARIITLESENTSTKKQLQECEKQKQIFEEYLNKASSDYRQLMAEKTENDTKLNQEVKNIRQALEIINREKTEMTEKMTKLQDDYESSIIDNEQLNVLLNQSKFFSQQHIEKVEKAEKALEDATIRMNSEIERLNNSCQETVSNLKSQLQSSQTECDKRIQSLQQQLAETQDMLKSKSEQLEGKELSLKTFMEERYQKKSKIEAELQQLQSDFNENNQKFAKQQEEWKNARDIIMAKEKEYQGDISQKDETIKRLNSERQEIETMMREKEEALNKRLLELQLQYERCQSQPKLIATPRSEAIELIRPVQAEISNIVPNEYSEALMVSAPSSGSSTPMFDLSKRLKELSKSPKIDKMAKRAEKIRQNMENKKITDRQSKSGRSPVSSVSEESERKEDPSKRDLEWKAEQRVKWDRYRELSKKLPILNSQFDQAKKSLSDFLGGDSNRWSGDKHDRIDRLLESDKTALKQKLDSGKINQSVYQTELQKITKKQTDEVLKYRNLKTAYDIARSELNQAIGELRQLSSILNAKEKINETEKLEEERFLFGRRKKNGKKSKRTKRQQKRRSTNRNNRKNRK